MENHAIAEVFGNRDPCADREGFASGKDPHLSQVEPSITVESDAFSSSPIHIAWRLISDLTTFYAAFLGRLERILDGVLVKMEKGYSAGGEIFCGLFLIGFTA
jgi:hypothetical protein